MLALVTSIAASSSVLVLALWYAPSQATGSDVRLRTLMEPQRMLVGAAATRSRSASRSRSSTALVNLLLAVLPTR